MTKSQLYYYEDKAFQLELNLQDVRRDLIQLLEDYEYTDCLNCNRLKCDCSIDSFASTTLSVISDDSAFQERDRTMDVYYNTAPPPESLPTPRWPENKTRNEHQTEQSPQSSIAAINIWVKASIPNVTQSNSRVNFPVPRKVLDQVNYSWPPFPKSIWSDEKLKETKEREDTLSNESGRDNCNSVEAFFRYFGGNKAISKTAFAC